MKLAELFTEYLASLFGGTRREAREVIFNAHDRGMHASRLLRDVVWPAMEQVQELYRNHKISPIVEHMAARINRTIADQLQSVLAREPQNGRRIVVLCGEGECEELGGQIMADLFEAKGWTVWFLGAGVPSDEILAFVSAVTPDILCIYGSRPREVPEIRRLIDLIREVGICEDMQVLVGGGVFNRAAGLAEEIRADLFAEDVSSAITAVAEHPVRVPIPDLPQPGRRRKHKHRMSAVRAKMRLLERAASKQKSRQ